MDALSCVGTGMAKTALWTAEKATLATKAAVAVTGSLASAAMAIDTLCYSTGSTGLLAAANVCNQPTSLFLSMEKALRISTPLRDMCFSETERQSRVANHQLTIEQNNEYYLQTVAEQDFQKRFQSIEVLLFPVVVVTTAVAYVALNRMENALRSWRQAL